MTDWKSAVADPARMGEMVGAMVMAQLDSIAAPQDKFVSVQMLIGWSNEDTEVHSIRVDPTDERPTIEPVNPSFRELSALWDVVLAYRDKHEITCPETVYQTDRIAVTATDFIGDCLRVVGYGKLDDDSLDYVGGNENRVPEDKA